ncbi:hypothetical protein [Arthrobacter sp. NPDC056727]|uniref:hypothetical protein n=1 Tax=Arthrobacter sp. NPDC056727 TaxID=3345927 RepID=UPI00366BBB45
MPSQNSPGAASRLKKVEAAMSRRSSRRSVSVEWHRQMLDTVYGGDPEAIAAEVRKLVVGGEEQIITAQRDLLDQRGG